MAYIIEEREIDTGEFKPIEPTFTDKTIAEMWIDWLIGCDSEGLIESRKDFRIVTVNQ